MLCYQVITLAIVPILNINEHIVTYYSPHGQCYFDRVLPIGGREITSFWKWYALNYTFD